MTDHDPYCRWPTAPCACADLAAVRADERDKFMEEVRSDIAAAVLINEARELERERIAQAIEAAQALYATGVHDARWAYKDAARIARNGGRDGSR